MWDVWRSRRWSRRRQVSYNKELRRLDNGVVTIAYPGQRKNLKLLTTRLGQTSSFSFPIFRRFDRGYYGRRWKEKWYLTPQEEVPQAAYDAVWGHTSSFLFERSQIWQWVLRKGEWYLWQEHGNRLRRPVKRDSGSDRWSFPSLRRGLRSSRAETRLATRSAISIRKRKAG